MVNLTLNSLLKEPIIIFCIEKKELHEIKRNVLVLFALNGIYKNKIVSIGD